MGLSDPEYDRLFLAEARTTTYEGAEYRLHTGRWSADQFEAYAIAWQLGAPRFGVTVVPDCTPFNSHVADLAIDLLGTSKYWSGRSAYPKETE